MIFKKVLLLLIVIGMILPFVNSAHYIVGYVNDALDGTDSEDHTLFLWNSAYGIGENLIDSIGVNGNAGQEAMYLLDCEALTHGCNVGDVLSVVVIDNGDGYISYSRNVTVTGAGYDFVENITLNSPPSVFLNVPINNAILNDDPVDFSCSFSDLDGPSGNLSFWGNFSGSWIEEGRYEVSSGDLTHIFSKSLPEGEYSWNCMSQDNLSISTFGTNRTLTVDLTPPTISYFVFNESSSCGNTSLQLICNSFDNYGLEQVLVEVKSPNFLYNLSLNHLIANNYSRNILINESGNWTFKCFSKDNAGNYNFLESSIFPSYSGFPELSVNGSKIIFNKIDPMEGEEVNVSALIENKGCVGSSNFIVSFFRDHPSNNDQLGLNITLSLSSFSSSLINLTYSAFVGKNNIFVFADRALQIIESLEEDNIGNNSISVTLWQEFYGNVSAVKVLKSDNNFSSWSIEEQVVGNVFVTDSESNIDWFSLKAIGKDILGLDSVNDFSDIDFLFGTENFNDSISREYLEEGQIKYQEDFLVHQKIISNVPVINSTNNENFVTGILWDSSDDTNGEFDIEDKEDLVFVTKLNNGQIGEYGMYDYEIRVPVELRSYNPTDNSEIYFYYNLV